jgi:hypothetical protein
MTSEALNWPIQGDVEAGEGWEGNVFSWVKEMRTLRSMITAKKRKKAAFVPCFISSVLAAIKGEEEKEKEEER